MQFTTFTFWKNIAWLNYWFAYLWLKGMFYFPGDQRYEGEWKEGKKNGQGNHNKNEREREKDK